MLLLLGVDVLVVKGDEMSGQPFVVHVVLRVKNQEDQVKSVKNELQLSDRGIYINYIYIYCPPKK